MIDFILNTIRLVSNIYKNSLVSLKPKLSWTNSRKLYLYEMFKLYPISCGIFLKKIINIFSEMSDASLVVSSWKWLTHFIPDRPTILVVSDIFENNKFSLKVVQKVLIIIVFFNLSIQLLVGVNETSPWLDEQIQETLY